MSDCPCACHGMSGQDAKCSIPGGCGHLHGPTNATSLPQLLDQMRAIARRLTDITMAPSYDEETGKITTHPVQPLVEQLQDAVGHGGETGASRGKSNPLPFDPGAFEVLRQVQEGAIDVHLRALQSEPYGPIERIRAIVALAGRWTSPAAIAWVIEQLAAWTTLIDKQLNPDKQYHFRHRGQVTPCPACGVAMVRRQVAGEWRLDTALQIIPVTEAGVVKSYVCRCVNRECGTEWPTAHIKMLIAAIEQDHAHNEQGPLASATEGTTGRLADLVLVDCTCDHPPAQHERGSCAFTDRDDEKCPCTGHLEAPPARDFGWPVYTADTLDAYQRPPCPNCGAPSEVEWCEVTGIDHAEPTYLPGMHICTANCALLVKHKDPRKQQAMRQELRRKHLGWRLGSDKETVAR